MDKSTKGKHPYLPFVDTGVYLLGIPLHFLTYIFTFGIYLLGIRRLKRISGKVLRVFTLLVYTFWEDVCNVYAVRV